MKIRAGFFQFGPQFGKPDKNLEKVLTVLQTARADLIVLPELPFSGYYFTNREEVKNFAEPVRSSDIIKALIKLCRERKMLLVTGFAEKYRDKYFNSSLLIGPEGIIHTYRKLHLFNEEKKWFDPGDIPLEVKTVRDIRIGMMICFDWLFPEVMRTLVLQGAQLIAHPSNLVLDYCQKAMQTRCLENNTFAITCNRIGADSRPKGKIRFTGKSQITAPRGTVVFRAGVRHETLYIAELDLSLTDERKITPLNDVLSDRRPDFYKN